LGVEVDEVLTAIDQQQNPEVINGLQKKIQELFQERDVMLAKTSSLETELTVARQKEADAYDVVRKLKEVVGQLVDNLVKAKLMNDKIIQEGITGSKVVKIMTDFEMQISLALKKMQKLLGHLDPDVHLNIKEFPKVPSGLFRATSTQPGAMYLGAKLEEVIRGLPKPPRDPSLGSFPPPPGGGVVLPRSRTLTSGSGLLPPSKG